MLDVLYNALSCRGIPRKIYTDQGKVFTCEHIREVCARLEIRLIHAKPYSPQGKGKIERFFRTVRSQFLQGLNLKQVHTLQEMNQSFHLWLESCYHSKEHSSIAPDSPATRFQKQSDAIRWVKNNQTLKEMFQKI